MSAPTRPASLAGRARRSDAELREVAARAATRFADAAADPVLAWAAAEFGPLLSVACSMADGVLPDVVAHHAPGVDVLFLDTGYHFTETLATRDRVAAGLDVHVIDVRPPSTVAEQDAVHGTAPYARDPDACCRRRKVEPLAAALAGYEAWVTGVRRDEGPTRSVTPVVAWDATFGLVKINPLATWSFDDVMGWARACEVPVNPLLGRGYPSIGCAPCTRSVPPGADPRSGRWAAAAKTECGLHR